MEIVVWMCLLHLSVATCNPLSLPHDRTWAPRRMNWPDKPSRRFAFPQLTLGICTKDSPLTMDRSPKTTKLTRAPTTRSFSSCYWLVLSNHHCGRIVISGTESAEQILIRRFCLYRVYISFIDRSTVFRSICRYVNISFLISM